MPVSKVAHAHRPQHHDLPGRWRSPNLNEQSVVAGVDQGLAVNDGHVSALGVVDMVVDRVRSDLADCP